MESSVLKILEDYLSWEELAKLKSYDKLNQNEKDEFRLENDNDAKYYYEVEKSTKKDALCSDTIISFWTPYKRLLEIETGWRAFRTIDSLKALIYQIRNDRKNDYTEAICKVNRNIEDFAQICYTKGNYMLLPNRYMNNQRYRITEDRIDLSIYECFGKGALAKFFKTEDDLKDWIEKQNLSTIFIRKEICRENLKWFVTEDKPKWISEMSAFEVYEYLENAMVLINERNN